MKTENKSTAIKTYIAKRKMGDGYSAEYKVRATDKDEAVRKIFQMCGERLKVTEK